MRVMALDTTSRGGSVALVDDGRVVELGSHAELLAKRGQYYALFNAWVEHSGGAQAA